MSIYKDNHSEKGQYNEGEKKTEDKEERKCDV